MLAARATSMKGRRALNLGPVVGFVATNWASLASEKAMVLLPKAVTKRDLESNPSMKISMFSSKVRTRLRTQGNFMPLMVLPSMDSLTKTLSFEASAVTLEFSLESTFGL